MRSISSDAIGRNHSARPTLTQLTLRPLTHSRRRYIIKRPSIHEKNASYTLYFVQSLRQITLRV